MRGRLIFPMTAVVAKLDTAATSAAGGYDPILREVVLVDTNGDGIGEPLRKEMGAPTYTRFPAQVENDKDEMQRMTGAGDIPDNAVVLVVHLRDMERLSLLDTTKPGSVTIQKGDRLVSLVDKLGNVVRSFKDAPGGGYFCTHVRLADGWIGRRANLTYIAFAERARGVV